MRVTAEEILNRARRDYPLVVEVCELRSVVERLQAEVRQLKAEAAGRDGQTRVFPALKIPAAAAAKPAPAAPPVGRATVGNGNGQPDS